MIRAFDGEDLKIARSQASRRANKRIADAVIATNCCSHSVNCQRDFAWLRFYLHENYFVVVLERIEGIKFDSKTAIKQFSLVRRTIRKIFFVCSWIFLHKKFIEKFCQKTFLIHT